MTSSELAARLGVSGMTIRNWSEQFAEHLSPSASPEGQGRRYFTPEDCAIMETVAALRQRQMGYEAIGEELAAGRRERLPDDSDPGEAESGTGTGLSIQRMTAMIGQYQGNIEQLTQERDYLRERWEAAEEARRQALERAARAEGKLEAIQEAQRPQEAPSEPVQSAQNVDMHIAPVPSNEPAAPSVGRSHEEQPRPWWRRLFG